jgi:hypothetical protein
MYALVVCIDGPIGLLLIASCTARIIVSGSAARTLCTRFKYASVVAGMDGTINRMTDSAALSMVSSSTSPPPRVSCPSRDLHVRSVMARSTFEVEESDMLNRRSRYSFDVQWLVWSCLLVRIMELHSGHSSGPTMRSRVHSGHTAVVDDVRSMHTHIYDDHAIPPHSCSALHR